MLFRSRHTSETALRLESCPEAVFDFPARWVSQLKMNNQQSTVWSCQLSVAKCFFIAPFLLEVLSHWDWDFSMLVQHCSNTSAELWCSCKPAAILVIPLSLSSGRLHRFASSAFGTEQCFLSLPCVAQSALWLKCKLATSKSLWSVQPSAGGAWISCSSPLGFLCYNAAERALVGRGVRHFAASAAVCITKVKARWLVNLLSLGPKKIFKLTS